MNANKLFVRLLIATLVIYATTSCSKDNAFPIERTTVDSSILPEQSRTMISTHFSSGSIKSTKKSASPNVYNSIYKVLLSNGFEIDFDKDGRWTEIESDKDLRIPDSFLSAELPTILQYITENHPDQYVIELEREKYGFSVELNNGIELIFDADQRLIGIDVDDKDDETRIPVSDLPQISQTLLNNTFPNVAIVTAKKERDDNRVMYKVYLANGLKITFDHDGNWEEIESKREDNIPLSLLPNKIADYVTTNYPNYILREVEINHDKSYSLELEHKTTKDDIELEFDADGNFLGIDD